MKLYFADVFGVTEAALEKYGAFNIVRRMMILTIEHGWSVGLGPAGREYAACQKEEWDTLGVVF